MGLHPQNEANPKETEILEKARQGDSLALEALFGQHAPALYRTALRVLGDEAEAEDALQDGLLSAYRNLSRFEGRSQFSSWLTRIVINAALMRRRRQRNRLTVSLDEPQENELPFADLLPHPGPNPHALYVEDELRDLLAVHVAGLSPALRSAFLLRYAGGLSNQETADVLGITPLAVKTRVHRARAELCERLRPALRPDQDNEASAGQPE